MSARKSQPSPPANTYLDTIIRKFDSQSRSFIFVSVETGSHPIIFCNDGFCELTGFSRAEVMQKSGECTFLHGPETSELAIAALKEGLAGNDERQLDMELRCKEGRRFTCSILLAPVRNERSRVILFIVDFEDLTSETDIFQPSRKTHKGIATLRNILTRKLASARGDTSSVPYGSKQEQFDVSQESRAVFGAQQRSIEHHASTEKTALQSKVAMRLAAKDGSFYGPIGTAAPTIVCTTAGSESSSSSGGGRTAGTSDSRGSPLSPSDSSTVSQNEAAQQALGSSNKQLSSVDVLSPLRSKAPSLGSTQRLRASDALSDKTGLKRLSISQKASEVQSLSPTLSTTDHKLQSDKVHRCVILHYSPAKTIWDWLVLILVLYTAISTPYSAAFLLGEKAKLSASNSYQDDPFAIIDLIIDIIFITDVLINFRTTYVNKHEEVVSDPGKLAIHYFKGWFLIDMLTAIPFDLLLVGSNADSTAAMMLELLKTVRLLRLAHVTPMLGHYKENGAAVLLLLMSTFTLFAHWFACIFYAIAVTERPFLPEPKIGWIDMLSEQIQKPINDTDPLSGPSLSAKYVTSLYFTFSSLTSVGYGNIAPNTDAEKVFAIVMMLLGSLMYASIFGIVSAIIQRLYSGTARYHNELSRVKEFIRFHQIVNPLRQRLEEYFEHAWTYTNGIDMNMVLKDFPDCLQADICLHLNNKLLSNCPAFSGASPGCLRALSMKFHTIHVPPGDILVHHGDVLNAIYFISRGSIEIVKGSMVMAVLGKGDIFGEHICKYRTVGKSSCNVRALIYSDLHKILREDLIEVLQMYPEFTNTFERNLEVTFSLRDESLTRWRWMDELLIRGTEDTDLMTSGRSRWKVLFHRLASQQDCTCPSSACEVHRSKSSSSKEAAAAATPCGKNSTTSKGILEISPAMAGQDVTPLNLTFGASTRKSIKASLAGALEHKAAQRCPLLNATAGSPSNNQKQQLKKIDDSDEEKMALIPSTSSAEPSQSTDPSAAGSGGVEMASSCDERPPYLSDADELINLDSQSAAGAATHKEHPATASRPRPPSQALQSDVEQRALANAEQKFDDLSRQLDRLENKLENDIKRVLQLMQQRFSTPEGQRYAGNQEEQLQLWP